MVQNNDEPEYYLWPKYGVNISYSLGAEPDYRFTSLNNTPLFVNALRYAKFQQLAIVAIFVASFDGVIFPNRI